MYYPLNGFLVATNGKVSEKRHALEKRVSQRRCVVPPDVYCNLCEELAMLSDALEHRSVRKVSFEKEVHLLCSVQKLAAE